jgi:hypothetical protein
VLLCPADGVPIRRQLRGEGTVVERRCAGGDRSSSLLRRFGGRPCGHLHKTEQTQGSIPPPRRWVHSGGLAGTQGGAALGGAAVRFGV